MQHKKFSELSLGPSVRYRVASTCKQKRLGTVLIQTREDARSRYYLTNACEPIPVGYSFNHPPDVQALSSVVKKSIQKLKNTSSKHAHDLATERVTIARVTFVASTVQRPEES